MDSECSQASLESSYAVFSVNMYTWALQHEPVKHAQIQVAQTFIHERVTQCT